MIWRFSITRNVTADNEQFYCGILDSTNITCNGLTTEGTATANVSGSC